jgi:hypothetical protein
MTPPTKERERDPFETLKALFYRRRDTKYASHTDADQFDAALAAISGTIEQQQARIEALEAALRGYETNWTLSHTKESEGS